MHLLVAFLIGTAFLGGYFQTKEIPEKTIDIAVENRGIRLKSKVDPLSDITNARTIKQQYDYSCGSAALATLLNYHLGESLTERQVISGMLNYGNKEMIIRRRAFSFLDMKRFVDALGYSGAGYKADISDLKDLDIPGIVPIKLFGYRHFTVFRGVHDGHIFLSDPWKGNISFTEKEFLKSWYQNVIFLAHSEGKKTLGLMALRESDLRYINEDTANKIMFDPLDSIGSEGSERLFETEAGAGQIYKR